MNKKPKKALRKLRTLLAEARKRDLNEADTRNLVEKLMVDVLGYDLFKDISAEEPVEHRAADYAVRVKKKIAFLVEIKSIQTKLKDNHVFQVKNYAASKGVPWCVLTNGAEYRLYHIDFSEAVRHDIVFEINVVDDDLRAVEEKLTCLCRTSIGRGELERLWRRKRSLSEEGLLEVLLSHRVLSAMRRQVQPGSKQRITEIDIARALKRMFAEQLYEAYERLAQKLQRKKRRRQPADLRQSVSPSPPAPQAQA